jgi:hypothetical protein
VDLYRVYLCHKQAELFVLLADFMREDVPQDTILVALRAATNYFAHQTTTEQALQHSESLLDLCSVHLRSKDRDIRMAAGTLILNFTVKWLAND